VRRCLETRIAFLECSAPSFFCGEKKAEEENKIKFKSSTGKENSLNFDETQKYKKSLSSSLVLAQIFKKKKTFFVGNMKKVCQDCIFLA
jgi:hypothetical protein